MRQIMVLVGVALVLMAIAGCASLGNALASGSVQGIMGAVSGGGSGRSVAPPAEGGSAAPASGPTSQGGGDVAEFRGGEVLVCESGSSMFDESFFVATILTPASDATRGQAEALIIENGQTRWVKFVVPSHKTRKEEIRVGAAFFVTGWSYDQPIDPSNYRKTNWKLLRVTNTDELFKNIVELGGDKYHIANLRTPDSQVR